MDAIKPWYLSRTIWASIVAVTAALATALGLPIDGADQAAAVEAVLQGIAAIGGLIAIYGRVAAKSRIR